MAFNSREEGEVCNLSMKCTSYPFNGIRILCHTHEFHNFCNLSIPGVEDYTNQEAGTTTASMLIA